MVSLLGKILLFMCVVICFHVCCNMLSVVCLFVLRLNVPVNNFSVMSGRDGANASWV